MTTTNSQVTKTSKFFVGALLLCLGLGAPLASAQSVKSQDNSSKLTPQQRKRLTWLERLNKVAKYLESHKVRGKEGEKKLSDLQRDVASARELQEALKSRELDLNAVPNAGLKAQRLSFSAHLAHRMNLKVAGKITFKDVLESVQSLNSTQFPDFMEISESQAKQYASLSNFIALLEVQKEAAPLSQKDQEKLENLKNFQHAYIFDVARRRVATQENPELNRESSFAEMKSKVEVDFPNWASEDLASFSKPLKDEVRSTPAHRSN